MKHKEICLRAVEPEDLEHLYRWENNPDYWLVSNLITPYSKYILKKYIENAHKTIFETGQVRMMIDHSPTGKTIGTIDLFDYDPFHMRAGIGILIAEEEYRRKGFASMALECLIDYSFNTLQLHQLYCTVLSNNCESLSLFRKLGFVETGIRKDWIKSGDRFLDEHILQLLKK